MAKAAGVEVVGGTIQHLPVPNKVTYIGKGKLNEVIDLKDSLFYDVVIFDDELTPVQQRNLEDALKVKVIDTTAAGDAFMGAMACGLAENKPIREVLMFANAAGALATTKLGAQPSLPLKKELDAFLAKGI